MNTLALCQWMVRLTKAGLTGEAAGSAAPVRRDEGVWDNLYETSCQHGLTPLVHAGILACHLTPPGPVAARFVKYVRAAELRAGQAYDQLREISGAFAKDSIDLIALKGVPFAFRYYATPGLRRFGDIDILVRVSQLDQAGAVLDSLGYTNVDSHETDHPSFYLDHELKYHCGYERGSEFPVELHWNLVPKRSPVQFDIDSLWERSYIPDQAKDLGRALAFEDEAVFLAVHMARHEFLMPARAFVDLALLLSATPGYDASLLWQRAQESAATADLAASLGVAAQLGLVTLPADLAEHVAKTAAAAGLDLAKLSRYALTWPKFEYSERAVDVLTAPGPVAALKMLREIAFPKYDSLVEREEKTAGSEPGDTPAKRAGYGGLWKARVVHWARKIGNLSAEMGHLLVSVRMRRLFFGRAGREKE